MKDRLRAFAFAMTLISTIGICVGIVALSIAYGSIWALVVAVPAFAIVLATAIVISGTIFL